MDHFTYKEGELHAEHVRLRAIAQEIGTPFYCYTEATISRHYQVFAELWRGLDATICYAVKANANLAVIRTLARLGAGADVVSEGEVRRALAAGVPPSKIVYSGVGKTRDEIAFALKQDIWQFNVESEAELYALSEVAASLGRMARVALRVNPDIEGGYTHGKITTGTKESKFGIDLATARQLYKEAMKLSGIAVQGVSVHIGSQLIDFAPFKNAFTRVAEFVRELKASGVPIQTLDLGGGVGINYGTQQNPDLERYAEIVREAIAGLNCRIIFEPGRMIVGNAGVLVTKVIYVKDAEARHFVIVDAAMNDLIRPSLYGSYHEIVPVREASADAPIKEMDIVGPVCETGDIFAELRPLPVPKPGDLLAFRSAGAYGAVMASMYNSRLTIPEVMASGERWEVVRRRPSYQEMLDQDTIPEWLT